MLNDIYSEAEAKMKKSIAALGHAFNKIRTGRANPSILDGITVDYYGTPTGLAQVANINVEDGRTLAITPWEKHLTPVIEKAIMTSDLGINPSTNGDTVRVTMAMLTEETRKEFTKMAKAEAEKGRISVRNARRDANDMIKDFLKEKDISEDEAREGEDHIQKSTNQFIAEIEKQLEAKEAELMKV